jgi:hypothetical protein
VHFTRHLAEHRPGQGHDGIIVVSAHDPYSAGRSRQPARAAGERIGVVGWRLGVNHFLSLQLQHGSLKPSVRVEGENEFAGSNQPKAFKLMPPNKK